MLKYRTNSQGRQLNKIYFDVSYSRNSGKVSEFFADRNGNIHKTINEDWKPSLYIENPRVVQNTTESNLKSFDEKKLYNYEIPKVENNYHSDSDVKNGVSSKATQFKENGVKYHGDIAEYVQYIRHEYPENITEELDFSVPTCFIDIECMSAQYEMDSNNCPNPTKKINSDFPYPSLALNGITAITVYDFINKSYRVFLCQKTYTGTLKNPSDKHIIFEEHLSEHNMLESFWKYLKRFAIISGWNSIEFDWQYLVNRSLNVYKARLKTNAKENGANPSEKDLESNAIKQFNKNLPSNYFYKKHYKIPAGKTNIEIESYKIPGYVMLDYMLIFRKFNMEEQENYTLDYITEKYVDHHKIDYKSDGYIDLDDLYFKNFNLYVEYNIVDVELIDRLEQKFGYIALAQKIAYLCKVNIEDMYYPTRYWDAYLYNAFMDKGYVAPPKKETAYFPVPGGYVKDPIKGISNWVISYDVSSLYPNLIISGRFSPFSIKDTYNQDFDWTMDDKSKKQLNAPPPLSKTIDDLFEDGENYDNDIENEYGSERFLQMNEALLNKSYNTNINQLKQNKVSMSTAGFHFNTDGDDPLCDIVESIFNMRMDYRAKSDELIAKKDRGETIDEGLLSTYDNLVYSLKIMINSLYGCFGNRHFRYYDPRIATSITSTGQYLIQKTEQAINDYLNDLASKHGIENRDFINIIDTDSVTGDSILYVNNKKIRIDELYSQSKNKREYNNGKWIGNVDNSTALSFNESSEMMEYKSIKYVMKHVVNKNMYSIKGINRNVVVTEDHSVIVKRNGKYESISAKNINDNDWIVQKLDFGWVLTSNFEIECLGKQEIEVYDIEVEDNHNFFANDILVHNSNYVVLGDFVKKWYEIEKQKGNDVPDLQQTSEFVLKFANKHLQPLLKDVLANICEELNFKKNNLDMAFEKICDVTLSAKKRRYILSVVNKEGSYKPKRPLTIKGIEIVKTNTPHVVRDDMRKMVRELLDNPVEEYAKTWLKTYRETYDKYKPIDLAFPRSCRGMNKQVEVTFVNRNGFQQVVLDERGNPKMRNAYIPETKSDEFSDMFGKTNTSIGKWQKATPIAVRGAFVFNDMLKHASDVDLPEIASGNKVKYMYLKKPNPSDEDVISFPVGYDIPPQFEVEEHFDWEVMWEKTVVSIASNIFSCMGWTVKDTNEFENSFEDLF